MFEILIFRITTYPNSSIKRINQPTNQPTNQSINQPISQRINHKPNHFDRVFHNINVTLVDANNLYLIKTYHINVVTLAKKTFVVPPINPTIEWSPTQPPTETCCGRDPKHHGSDRSGRAIKFQACPAGPAMKRPKRRSLTRYDRTGRWLFVDAGRVSWRWRWLGVPKEFMVN